MTLVPLPAGYNRGMPTRIHALCACLLGWNILFAISWIALSEAAPVNRASEKHGHVKDTDERIKRMRKDMDAERALSQPYYPVVIVLTGVNVVLSIMVLAAIPKQLAISAPPP
jgi:hypothetical protein